MVTDNGIDLSGSFKGRSIKDFKAYAEGLEYNTLVAMAVISTVHMRHPMNVLIYQRTTKPALLHVHSLPRLNAHSSAADYAFDLKQPDPLIAFESIGEQEVLQKKKS